MRRGLFLLVAGAVAVLVFSSCASERQQSSETSRRSRTVTVERRQVLAADGVTVTELTTRTTTITDEATGQTLEESTVTEAPKIVGVLGQAVKTVATATMGPAAGQAVQAGIGWLEALLGGGGIAATMGGTGAVMLRRQKQEADAAREEAARLERHRQQLIDGVESAKRHMSEDTWRSVRATLEDNQDDDLIQAVRQRTAG